MTYTYYVALLVPLFLYLLPLKLSNNKKLFLASIPMLFIILFRFGVGTDYFSYEYIYNALDISSVQSFLKNPQGIEFGYRGLMLVPKILGVPFHIFVALIGLVIYAFYFKWISDNSKSPVLSLLLFFSMFFLVWNLSALRQGLVLSIGTYAFYNKKVNLKPISKIILILLLSTIHISALLYLVFLLIEKIKWSRNTLIGFLVFSITFALLPIYKVLPLIDFVPGVSKMTQYIDGPTVVMNFAGIARIFMFIFVALSYKFIESDVNDRRLANNFLIGICFFFLLKFSDLVAARISIYTFILACVLFVNIFESLKFDRIMKFSASILIGLTSFMFFQKEVHAYQDQVGVIESGRLLKFDSIFDYDRTDYYNRYNNLTLQKNLCLDRKIQFKKDFVDTKVEYTEGDTLIVVRKKDLYGVINQRSEWVVTPQYKGMPEVHGTVLLHNEKYYDLKSLNRDLADLEQEYLEEKSLDEAFMAKEMNNNGMLFKDLHVTSRRIILQPHLIKQATIEYSTEPKLHYIAEFAYLGYDAYIFSDGDQRPLFDRIYPNYARFNRQGIMEIRGYCGIEVLSITGETLWME